MKIENTPISGAYLITLNPHRDHRGYFMRCYDQAIFKEHGLVTDWVQENQSHSIQANTIRGLHYQRPPGAETKLVRALRGRLFDVMVDLRKHSPSYGQWFGTELSDENQQALYIPRGCAHGFCTLEANTIISYKVDNYYQPELEGTLSYTDATINIDWPIKDLTKAICSEKDLDATQWSDFDTPFTAETT